MTDRLPDFLDPDAATNVSDREVTTSSVFDAFEHLRVDDVSGAELCDLEDRSSRGALPGSPDRARRSRLLTATGAGLAVVVALLVHSIATAPVVPSPRRSVVSGDRVPAVSALGTRPLPLHSRSASASRRGSRGHPAGRQRAAAHAVDRAQPTVLEPRVAETSRSQAPVDEFGFEQ